MNATDEEIYEAARAAEIHDRILGFPDGYDTGTVQNFILQKQCNIFLMCLLFFQQLWVNAV